MKLMTQILGLSLISLSIIGCGGDTPNAKKEFEVKVINLTLAQPFSPVALVAHNDAYSLYTLGSSASEALEHLSEGGDNSEILLTPQVHTTSGAGLILPGQSETLSIKTKRDRHYLSLASMLVNTNDAFVGADAIDVENFEVGMSKSYTLSSYDAGTEVNSELASTIPGPAGGGEGFNEERNDTNFVSVHSGVITADDGLSSSALNNTHKWDNPTAKIIITRVR